MSPPSLPVLLGAAALSVRSLLARPFTLRTEPGPVPHPAPPATARVLERLFDADIAQLAFGQAVAEARTAGVLPQLILEARLWRHLRAGDLEAAASLLPEAERCFATLDANASRLFKTQAIADGQVCALRALRAQMTGDAAAFERWIKEAFWKAPVFAALYADWAKDFQQEQRMAGLTLPLDVALSTADGQTTTLRQLIGPHQAVLFDFWASWCQPCHRLLPELLAQAGHLTRQGVVVAGVSAHDDAGLAAAVKRRQKIDLPWLVEPATEPLSRPLAIDSLPRLVLVTATGQVLYNGHPLNPRLKTALAKIGVLL